MVRWHCSPRAFAFAWMSNVSTKNIQSARPIVRPLIRRSRARRPALHYKGVTISIASLASDEISCVGCKSLAPKTLHEDAAKASLKP